MVEYGLSGIVTSHGDILFALFYHDQLTMVEIANKIGKDKSTVTALINKLVKQGYVEKTAMDIALSIFPMAKMNVMPWWLCYPMKTSTIS